VHGILGKRSRHERDGQLELTGRRVHSCCCYGCCCWMQSSRCRRESLQSDRDPLVRMRMLIVERNGTDQCSSRSMSSNWLLVGRGYACRPFLRSWRPSTRSTATATRSTIQTSFLGRRRWMPWHHPTCVFTANKCPSDSRPVQTLGQVESHEVIEASMASSLVARRSTEGTAIEE
jgi:hypothetical protein